MADKYKLEVNFAIPNYEIHGTTVEGVQPGERLEGEVLFHPFEDVNCRGVFIEIGHHEKGRGTPYENRLVQSMIFEGSLRRNQPFSHHILFQIPDSVPPSYSGEYVTIEWFVRIRLDIPFWFDKREEFPFKVIPKLVKSKEEVDFTTEEKLGKLKDF